MANMKPDKHSSTSSLPKLERNKTNTTVKPQLAPQAGHSSLKKTRTKYMSQPNIPTGASDKRRPILGYSASRVPVNRFFLERLGNEISRVKMSNIKRKKEQPMDIRFRSGESVRMLSHMVSQHSLASTCTIMPYTEDITGLQKKNALLRTFSEDVFKKNMKDVKSRINQL
jgi:hypothetical protein